MHLEIQGEIPAQITMLKEMNLAVEIMILKILLQQEIAVCAEAEALDTTKKRKSYHSIILLHQATLLSTITLIISMEA